MPGSLSNSSRPLWQIQLLVFVGMAGATVALLAVWWSGYPAKLFPPPIDDSMSRLAFALRWLLVPALCLLAGIAMVANRRFFSAEAIDGVRQPTSRSLEVNLRYNQNTLEQVVIAGVAWLNLALVLPQHQLSLIPSLAIVFAIGRLLFWVGYLVAPWARAFGFALTFYPTVVVYIWLAGRALSATS